MDGVFFKCQILFVRDQHLNLNSVEKIDVLSNAYFRFSIFTLGNYKLKRLE